MSETSPPDYRGQPAHERGPAAGPAASSCSAPNPPDSGHSTEFRTGKSSSAFGVGGSLAPGAQPPLAAGSARSRIGKLAIVALRESLPERDLLILRSVAAHRFLTTRHITALHFADQSQDQYGSHTARKVLKRLDDASVLAHLEQRIGGIRAGSNGYVWRVGPVGDRLLRFGTGDVVRRGKRYEPSTRFLRHCLAIADLHIALLGAARNGRFELIGVELEPSTWREYTGAFGERRVLKPDLSAITGSGEYEDHFWFEVDLGNEHLPTILDKCRAYEAYRRTGLEDEHRGASVFPVVVWVMHTTERAERLRTELARTRGLDTSLFRVTTLDALPALVEEGAA